ncbi:MAG: hypothetical protein ACJATP_003641 [Candidatus Azotimanducaceae bacterium]|jgi:hypothetical protein
MGGSHGSFECRPQALQQKDKGSGFMATQWRRHHKADIGGCRLGDAKIFAFELLSIAITSSKAVKFAR